jgi:hypothetical protein
MRFIQTGFTGQVFAQLGYTIKDVLAVTQAGGMG